MKNLLLILFIPFLILGQETNQSNTNLKTVNIYGSMIDLNNIESGKNITIINSNDIENYSFNSIDELLKLIPSIELQSRGGFGTQSDIVLRGSTFNQTLVLLDGARVNDPLTGHFSMYIPINPFEIHQIEIIRGGGSSIYGPDAVGGVINIVTKLFKEGISKNEVIVESKVGSNGLTGDNLFIAKKLHEKFYTTLGVNLIKSDGQELYKDIFSFFDNQTFSLSHKYAFSNKLNVILRSAYAKRFFNSQYYYTRSNYDLSNETIRKSWTQAQINYKIDKNRKLSLMTSYQNVDDLYIFNPEFPYYQNYTELTNSNINYTKKTDSYRVVSGVNLQNRKIASIDRGNHSDYYIGSFVNFMKKIKAITINPSLRLDYNKSYRVQLCPQFDVNYNHDNYNLRTSFGRTIRSADFTERFYNNNYNGTLSAGRNIGNPDLKAETSLNWEIGIDIKKYKNATIKNTLFYRNASNLIDWVLMNSSQISTNIDLLENENYLFAQNISKLKTLGWESELWFNLKKFKVLNISGSLGYCKIFAAEENQSLFENNTNTLSKYLANNSGDRFNYNVFFDWKKWKFNLNGQMKIRGNESDLNIDQTLSQSYFVHNVNLNYALGNRLTYSAELINIFNKEYADILGAIMPKRWFVLGFKYSLQ